jgi:hypothetical protein
MKQVRKLREQMPLWLKAISDPSHATGAERRRALRHVREPFPVYGSYRSRKMWEVIIDFANATASSRREEDVEALVDSFVVMIQAGLCWIAADQEDIDLCDYLVSEIVVQERLADAAQADTAHAKRAAFEVLARLYQLSVKVILTWLSNPTAYLHLADYSVRFISKLGPDIEMTSYANSEFDANNPNTPLTYQGMERCLSVLSPVCRFLQDQIERQEIWAEELREAFPFRTCDRPGCNRFRIVKIAQTGRFFCSPSCKVIFHRSNKSKAERATAQRNIRRVHNLHKPRGGAKRTID